MREVIMGYQGEMSLKGLNRNQFESTMMKILRYRLKTVGKFRVYCTQSTFYMEPEEEDIDMDLAFERVSKVFGLAALSRAVVCEKDFDTICQTAEDYLGDSLHGIKTFKVEARRSDKTFPMTSPELMRELGAYLLGRHNYLRVDVKNPQFKVIVEIRDYGAYIHGPKIQGEGGLPVGTSGRALKAAYAAARRAHLSEIHAHATAVFAYLCKVVDASVNAFQAVRHRIDEAAGELMIGLARIGQRGRGHRHMHPAEHIVKFLYPGHAVPLFTHGQMQCDAQKHLLRSLQRSVGPVVDDISLEQQVQPGVCKQLIPLRPQKILRLLDLFPAVMRQDVFAVQPLVRQAAQLVVQAADAPLAQLLLQAAAKPCIEQARRDEFPARGLLARQLHSRLHQRLQRRVRAHARLDKALKLCVQHGQRIRLAGEILFDLGQHAVQCRNARRLSHGAPRRALLVAPVPVQNIPLCFLVTAVFHQHPFHSVLYVLHGPTAVFVLHFLFHRAQQAFHLLPARPGRRFAEGLAHGRDDLLRLVGPHRAVAFDDVPHQVPFFRLYYTILV